MSESLDTLEVALKNLERLEEDRERSTEMKGKDERTCKIIRNIRDLDTSIRELELQLKAVRAESLDIQLKNCEELRNKLASEPLETGSLAENTRRFLDLCAGEEKNEKLPDDLCGTRDKRARSSKVKLQENNEPQVYMLITDEEKRRLDFLTRDVSGFSNDTNLDRDAAILENETTFNPFSLDESSKTLLKELEDKLEIIIDN